MVDKTALIYLRRLIARMYVIIKYYGDPKQIKNPSNTTFLLPIKRSYRILGVFLQK